MQDASITEEAQAEPVQPPPQPKKSGKLIPGIILGSAAGCGCLALMGILAAIALPAFSGYLRRSKTSEATENLKVLFNGAASYYEAEQTLPGGTVGTFCSVEPAMTGNVPGHERQRIPPGQPSFEQLGFMPPEPVYYRYEIDGLPAHCGGEPAQDIYSFRAQGDLDGDGNLSLFEMSVGTDTHNKLYRARGST